MPDPDVPPVRARRPSEQEKQAVSDDFASQMRKIREHKQAVKIGLQESLTTITQAIRQHWTTGGGYRLRQIVWSLWNGETLINLYDVLNGLDFELGRAVAKLLEAQLCGALDSDDYLRKVLTDSGEFARYDEARENTPEGEDVIYPPSAVSASRLRDLAEAATNKEARYEAECRAEEERSARLEEANA